MMALLAKSYCWPKMEEDVNLYVRTCFMCQQDKIKRKSKADLLQPLPVAKRP